MRPTIIAITGSSGKLTQEQKWIVYHGVEEMVQASGGAAQWTSGGAHGVDLYAAEAAVRLDPGAEHHVYFPTWAPNPTAPPVSLKRDREGLRHLSTVAAQLGVYLKYHWCQPGVGPERGVGYLRRDDVLALNCTHMAAWPPTAHEAKRSGTWYTVRAAERLERPIKVFPLDGSPAYRR